MNWQVVFEPETSGRLCLTLLHSLWQVALAALVAGVAGRLLCRRSVERSYLVHVAALVVSVIAVPTTFAWLSQVGQRSVAAGGVARATMPTGDSGEKTARPEPNARTEAADPVGPLWTSGMQRANPPAAGGRLARWERWAPWLAGLYAVGVAAMLARLAAGVVRAERMRRTARPLVTGPAAAALRRLAAQWNVPVLPALAHAERIIVPTLVGLLKPTILLPASALAGLSSGELEMILAHELAHVRRRDMWVNLLQRLAEVALFFNPALWYLSRRIGALREYCCDEFACRAPSSPAAGVRVDYAATLLRVVELAHPHAAAYSGLATLTASGRSPSDLRRRIARLLGEPLREPLGISRGGLLCGGALLLVLILAPSWLHSQTPGSEPPAYPPPKSEADEAVAAARQRTFGLNLVPRISMRQRVKSGGVAGMAKAPELSLKKMFEACDKDFDETAWSGETSVTLAWTLRQLLIRTESGEAQRNFMQSHFWDGADGWICETSTQGRRVYRYGSLGTLMENLASIHEVYLPQMGAAGGRLPWGGAKIVLDEHASGPELTTYKHVGTETIDGVECQVYDGPQRMERLWIDKANGLVKAASRSYVHESLPNYYTELIREATGRTFADPSEYTQWVDSQSAEVKEKLGAHWSAAHWPMSEPGNLIVFSDYREIVPGVRWPMHCERIVVHAEGKDAYKYYRNAIDVTEVTEKFVMAETASDALPRDGDQVTDRRFAPAEPEFTYTWTDSADDAIEAARQKKLDDIRQADEANRKVNETPIDSADDAIKILTDGPKTDPTMVWARAIKYLVNHKDEGLSAAIKQLDGETRDHAISKLAFALRAIGDPRAVPALIRALPRTLLPGRSDYGLLLEEDIELLRFMQRNDQTGKVRGDAKAWFDYGRAFREVVSALHRLTNKNFGEMELNWLELDGTANQRRLKMQQIHAAAARWATWWENEGHTLVGDPAYATVNLPELAIDVGTPLGYELPAGKGVRLMSGPSGGIIESVHDSGKRCFVDLDTQREAGWPEELGPLKEANVDSPEALEWARREGFDVLGITYTPPGESEPLYCLKPLGMRAWKITAEEHKRLDEAFEGREPYPLSRPVELMVPQRTAEPPLDRKYGGDAFLFVTREGTAGLLRITAQVSEIGGGYASDPLFDTAGVHLGARVSLGWMNEEAR